VSSWDNAASGTESATQGTSSLQPTHSSANDNVVFDGGDQLILPDQSFTEYSIVGVTAGASGSRETILRKDKDNWSWLARFEDGNDLRLFSAHSGGENIVTYSGVGTAKAIFTMVASSASGLVTRYNGGDERTATNTGDLRQNSTDITIGAEEPNSVSEGLDGPIWDLVLVPNAISSDDARRLEGFVAHRNNLESNLPPGHPYKSNPP